MKKILFLITSLFILISSCERDVNNVSLPDFVQKLVINSFISPHDTVNFVSVTSNERIYGDLNIKETLGNLNVTISNGVKEISLEKETDAFVFRPEDILIEEGEKYQLKVASDRGLTAEATCKVPISRDLHIEADTIKECLIIPGVDTLEMIRANVYLTDYPGEENYFRFIAKILIYDSEYDYLPEFSTEGENPAFFSDEGRDGERIFVNTLTVAPYSESDSAFIIFYLLNTDKAYYKYHRSLNTYSSGQNPFTEISPAYSNIEGGLGIFASYVVDSLVFRFK